jgi:hypothetical protein
MRVNLLASVFFPEVSQFLKMANFSEIPLFLDPIELDRKDIVLLAVNDASDPSGKKLSSYQP